jgi:uncharacterized protein (DUF1330 family)
MSVFLIVDSKLKDTVKYQRFVDQNVRVVEKYGGRYHVRGENIKTFGSWRPERIAVIEFPTDDHFMKWLTSREYEIISHLLEEGAEYQAILAD